MEREKEINESEINDDEALKSQIAIRCAKAAFLLLSLKSAPSDHNNKTYINEERVRLLKVVADLKLELVKERYKNRHMKICSVVEIALQILVVLSFAIFCLIFASCRSSI